MILIAEFPAIPSSAVKIASERRCAILVHSGVLVCCRHFGKVAKRVVRRHKEDNKMRVLLQGCLLLSQKRIATAAKTITKILFKKNCFATINFIKITKQSLYKQNSFACSLANRYKPVAATLQRMLWWNYFCNNYKDDYKNNCSKELFCNTFGQDGISVASSHGTSNAYPSMSGLN